MTISSKTRGLPAREQAGGRRTKSADTLFSTAEHCIRGMEAVVCRGMVEISAGVR